jgi:CHAT domain-containing protein
MWSEVEVDDICRLAAEHVILSDSADQVLEPATRDRLKRELPKHAVALLSTHGVSDAASPWTGSGLYTADFDVHRGRDGLLTIRDFYEIDLSGAALLLLTACESAIADTDDPTGEQLGLPSAILAAGGSTVIGSLWLVEDLATALLVRQLFIEMTGGRSRSVNVSAGLALWRAQRWLRDLTRCGFDELLATLEHRGNPLPPDVIEGTSRLLDTRGPQPFSRPVFWASFQCYGAP